jgi:hypothetical protein
VRIDGDFIMSKLVILLVASIIIDSPFSWAKKPSPTACFDFNAPVRVSSGGGSSFKFNFHRNKRHKHHKKSPVYSDCLKEVMKNRNEIKKDLKEIDKKIENVISRKLKKAQNIVQEIDKKVENVAQHKSRVYKHEQRYQDRRSMKSRRQNIRDDKAWGSWCLFFTTDKNMSKCRKLPNKWDWLSEIAKHRHKRMRKKTTNRIERFNEKQEHLAEKIEEIDDTEVPYEEEKLSALFGSLHDQMADEFKSQNPEYADLDQDEFLEKLYKNAKYNGFAKEYLRLNLPELEDLINQKEVTAERIAGLKDLAQEMCNNEQVACPVAKDNFESFPSVDTFKEMISTVGTIYYTDKKMEGSYSQNLNVQNYDDIMDKQSRYITNDRSKDKMKQNYERSKDALGDLEWNMDPKNKNKEGYPRKIKSACGSCDDLEDLYASMKSSGGYGNFKELKKIFEQVGCPSPSTVENSCQQDTSAILKKNGFSKGNGSKDLTTIDQAVELYLEQPDLKKDSIIKSMNEIGLLVEESEDAGMKPCTSCEVIKSRMEALTEVAKETVIQKNVAMTDEDGELIEKNGEAELADIAKTVSYRVPKKNATAEEISTLQKLKDIAFKLKSDDCIQDEYRVEKPKNKCEEKTIALKSFIEVNDSLEDLNLDQQRELRNHKDTYEAFLTKERAKTGDDNFNCCDDVVGDLSGEILKTDTGTDIPPYLSRESTRIQLAETLSCLKCGGEKNEDIKNLSVNSTNPHVSCQFYKKNIEGQSGNIQGLLKSEGSPYTVNEFMQNEVYTCKDGPNKSLINRARDWETISYSSEGKFGDFSDLNMKCFIDPSGETVNLTCCDLKHNDPVYLDFKQTLQKNIAGLDLIAKGQSTPGGGRDSLSKWLKNQQIKGEFENSPETFCRDVWAKGYARESSSSTSGFAVCEYKGKSYWKVDPLKIKKTFGGTMGVQAPKAIQQ